MKHYCYNVTFRLCPAQNDGRIGDFGNMQRFRAWKHRDHACFRKIWIIRRLAYGRISRYRIFESYDGLSRKIELYDGIFAVIQSRFRKCTSELYRDMLLIFGLKVCRWRFKNTPTKIHPKWYAYHTAKVWFYLCVQCFRKPSFTLLTSFGLHYRNNVTDFSRFWAFFSLNCE